MADCPSHGFRSSWLVLVLCLAGQACLLLPRLDLLPVWGDEHFTLRATSGSAGEALAAVADEKNNPPLHTLLVHLWLLVGWPVSKIVAARALSVLFALASTVAMDTLWLRPLDPRVRLWFLALWTLSPCLLLYARVARPYTLGALVFIVALRAAVGWIREPDSLPRGLALGAGAATLLYVHYLPGLALLFSVLLVIGWDAVRARRRAVLAPASGVLVLVAAVYVPWLPNLWVALQRMAIAPPAAAGWRPEFIRPGYLLFSFILGETPPVWVMIPAGLVIPGFVYLVWRGARTRPEWLAVTLLTALAGYLGAGRWVSFVFTPARLLFLLPFFLLLAAVGAQRSRRAGRWACTATLFLSAGSITSYYLRSEFLNKAYLLPYDEIAALITKGPSAEKAVLVVDACNTDPSPLLDLIPGKVSRIVVSRDSTLDSLRRQLAGTNAKLIWYFRNTHDTSPGGLNRRLEEELTARGRVRRFLFVPYSWRDRWFMKLLGWQEQPTHFVQLLEIERVEGGLRVIRAGPASRT